MQATVVLANLAKFRQFVTMLTMFTTCVTDLETLARIAIWQDFVKSVKSRHFCLHFCIAHSAKTDDQTLSVYHLLK